MHFKHPRVSAVNGVTTWTFREKKKQSKANFFLRPNFNVYIDVNNRETKLEREIENKRGEFCWKKDMKIL